MGYGDGTNGFLSSFWDYGRHRVSSTDSYSEETVDWVDASSLVTDETVYGDYKSPSGDYTSTGTD